MSGYFITDHHRFAGTDEMPKTHWYESRLLFGDATCQQQSFARNHGEVAGSWHDANPAVEAGLVTSAASPGLLGVRSGYQPWLSAGARTSARWPFRRPISAIILNFSQHIARHGNHH